MARVTAKPKLAYKDRMDRHDDAHWLIWSNKWGCWYRAKSQGYTHDISRAGIFTKDEAQQHYDGSGVPRSHRDTEPFPISSVRRHLDIYERDVDREHTALKALIRRLRKAMEQHP